MSANEVSIARLALSDACLSYAMTRAAISIVGGTPEAPETVISRADDMFWYIWSQKTLSVPETPSDLQAQLNVAWDNTRPITKEQSE